VVSNKGEWPSSLLKKVFEVSLWATLIQDPSARRTKDSQPSAFGFEYCASHVRFRVFQQTARGNEQARDGPRLAICTRLVGRRKCPTDQRGGLPPGSVPADTQRVKESPGRAGAEGVQ